MIRHAGRCGRSVGAVGISPAKRTRRLDASSRQWASSPEGGCLPRVYHAMNENISAQTVLDEMDDRTIQGMMMNAATIGVVDYRSLEGDTICEKYDGIYNKILELEGYVLAKSGTKAFWLLGHPLFVPVFEIYSSGSLDPRPISPNKTHWVTLWRDYFIFQNPIIEVGQILIGSIMPSQWRQQHACRGVARTTFHHLPGTSS